jgi:hypothetical protein
LSGFEPDAARPDQIKVPQQWERRLAGLALRVLTLARLLVWVRPGAQPGASRWERCPNQRWALRSELELATVKRIG